MFTGIIEATGTINALEKEGSNLIAWISSPVSGDVKIDQSVAHNGVCLTIDALQDGQHRVTAIAETLSKTNIAQWRPGTVVNLERCMTMNGRLDGHFVQGHIDTTGIVTAISPKEGSWEFTIHFPETFAHLVIEKGSIALNGISLTIFNVTGNSFTVAVIPYTYQHTNMQQLAGGDRVNLEFDMVGKYITRFMKTQPYKTQ